MTDKLQNTSISAVALNSSNLGKSGDVPDWVHLARMGKNMGRDGRGPFFLNNPQSVINNSLALNHGIDGVIDYEHQTDFASENGQPAPAAGWIKEYEAREDGLWGKIDWTTNARKRIEAKEYRYVSPAISYNKQGEIVAITRASLVNVPNLNLAALNKYGEDNMADKLKGLLVKSLGLSKDVDDEAIVKKVEGLSLNSKKLDEFAKALGVKTDASSDEIKTALNKNVEVIETQGLTPDPAQYVPMAAFEEVKTSLHKLQKDVSEDKASDAVEKAVAAGKISPAMKDWAVDLHKSNPKAFADYLETAPTIVSDGQEVSGSSPEGGTKTSLNKAELAVCEAMGISKEEYLEHNKEV